MRDQAFKQARRYDAPQAGRSTSAGSGRRRAGSADQGFGGAVASVVIKELKGTTGRRIVRGILGGLFRGR
ncbi:hypothetical protein SAMN04488003_12536 [Loktanella fryxellensis]|uniref:Helicase HerA-like C-terminal domain-containing protein n=1 Tax=Loktanella fryxellensis TaxID=245187 RepID=A0A1H8IG06_9RHOB|nr:hypothetical protein SAMN04488003_12536 [Loktanella fryxellensis]